MKNGMMKKLSIILIALLSAAVSLNGQGRTVERAYISTDKSVYVAGDDIWCSAFCFDGSNGMKLSSLSTILYVEIISTDGVAQTGKIALLQGRGAGKISLPATIPTGNYKLIAYTSQNKNEADYQYDNWASKTISVFNTLTKERVKDGVEVVESHQYDSLAKVAVVAQSVGDVNILLPRNIEFAKSSTIPVTITNGGKEAASLSVAVYHEDAITGNISAGIADVVRGLRGFDAKSIKFEENAIPDYDGEIIRARLVTPKGGEVGDLSHAFGYLSVPGGLSDVYVSKIDKDGGLTFYTNNIYGEREVVCEPGGSDLLAESHIEIVSPFVNPKVADVPRLILCDAISEDLLSRSVGMQIEKRFGSDTLYEYLPVREDPLFTSNSIEYQLDDYTRFPLMEEVIVEYVSQMRAQKGREGKVDLQIRLEDSFGSGNNMYFSNNTSLIMVDGVPILNHSKVFNYDPLLVEKISIFPHTYTVGDRLFEGVANFKTYKGNLPSIPFDDNVRIVNYQGASYPAAYTCSSAIGSADYPDYRQTIYWHPVLSVEGGESYEFDCKTPAYSGRFVIVVEGVASDGTPIYARSGFELR